MESSDGPAKITLRRLQVLSSRYDQIISSSLQDLDKTRAKRIPEALAQRRRDGCAYLDKIEVTALLDWKLKHGKYRPTLPKLLSSNPPQDVRSTTQDAFTAYTTNAPSHDPIQPLKTLTKLKGIGPATASLVLSCYDPETIPFFSDELYRWILFAEGGKGEGWDRKIGYTMKEYKDLYTRVEGLRERLKRENAKKVGALDVEKAAYVLCKECVSFSGGKRKGEGEKEGDEMTGLPGGKRQRKR